MRGAAFGGRVTGAAVDDGNVAEHPDYDLVRDEALDCHRPCRLGEEPFAVDQ
jgi:hypothetical protein